MKTVQDVLNAEAGEVIVGVQGKLLNIKDRKAGTNAKGAWSVQQMELMDATGKVRVKAWNHPDLSHLNGREVEIRAHKSEKHGWSGAIALDDSFTPNDSQVPVVTRELKVTATGLITPLNGSTILPAGTPPPTYQTPAIDPVEACERHLTRASVAMVLVMKAAMEVATEWEGRTKNPLPPEHFQSLCATLFINLDKSGLIQSLPSAPIENK